MMSIPMIDKVGDQKVAEVVAGTRVGDNREASRFEITIDSQTAFLEYERQLGRIRLIHTEVPLKLQGRGLGNLLAKHALDAARSDRLTIIAECPVVQAYLRKNPIR